VSRLPQRKAAFPAAYLAAEDAWFSGDYQQTLEILARSTPVSKAEKADTVLLRSRALQRAGDYEAALVAARATGPALDADRAASALLLQGSALLRLGRHEESRAALATALSVARVHRTIVAEILHQQALLAWTERDLRSARDLANQAASRAKDIVLAKVQALLGYINVSEEKFADAARSFREALATLATTRHRDEFTRANVLMQVASYALERLDVRDIDLIRGSRENLPASQDLSELRFFVYNFCGQLELATGNAEAAWRDFTISAALAPEHSPNQIRALISFTNLHRVTGEMFSAKQNTALAIDISSAIDWAQTNHDERIAYISLAIEAARLEMPLPVASLAAIEKLPEGVGDNALERGDRRYAAMVKMAMGLTLAATNVDRALRLLNDALDVWLAIGYRFRAATTALDLYRLTSDSSYLTLARREVPMRNRGYLTVMIRDALRREEHGFANLGKAGRRVLAGLLDGKSNEEIAVQIGRSLQTVKNQTALIYRELGVQSRAELIVQCSLLGITSKSLDSK
jgi:DNA-binding CsgD family transcriptional regulator